MQNHESNNKLRQFWKTKGYYMLLILCLAAAGVSGYLFLSGAWQEQKAVEEQLSVSVQEEPVKPEAETAEEVPMDSSEVSAEAAVEPEQQLQPVVEQSVMPVSGSVIRDYAMEHLTYNPTTRDWRVHTGVDLAASVGQPVKAARGGTVTAVYEDPYLGHTVVIRHSGDYTTHYCGLAPDMTVAAGDVVTAGQPLGTIGNTVLIEAAEEPHLHFEVYCNGEPVDPAGFLY